MSLVSPLLERGLQLFDLHLMEIFHAHRRLASILN